MIPDLNLFHRDPRRGMAVAADAHINTLAHEIGHACNLRDIMDRPVGVAVSESLSGVQNWSGGEGAGYHEPDLIHAELVRRLLMFYMGNPQKTDIPLEAVTGRVPGASSDGFISVGLNDMRSREPRH